MLAVRETTVEGSRLKGMNDKALPNGRRPEDRTAGIRIPLASPPGCHVQISIRKLNGSKRGIEPVRASAKTLVAPESSDLGNYGRGWLRKRDGCQYQNSQGADNALHGRNPPANCRGGILKRQNVPVVTDL